MAFAGTKASALPATPDTVISYRPHEAAYTVSNQWLWRFVTPLGALALMLMILGYGVGRGGITAWICMGLAAPLLGFMILIERDRIKFLDATPWARGMFGEQMISKLLWMLPIEFHRVEDITVTSNGKTSNIDHLVVGPTGIWLIETKNISGSFERRGSQLYINGVNQTKILAATQAKATELKYALLKQGITVKWVNAVVASAGSGIRDGKMEFEGVTVISASYLIPHIVSGKTALRPPLAARVVKFLHDGEERGA